jgi:DNA repair exonuclease SbcCD nuclease subunit
MADLHLHEWSSFSGTTPDGQNTRLVGLLDEITRCAKETHEAGGTVVIMAGDIFHVRGSVSPPVLNALRDRLNGCNQQFGTCFIILAGNHDLAGKDSTRLGSAVTALECGYVSTVSASEYFRATGTALVPWHESIDDLKAAIKALDTGPTGFFPDNTDLILHAPIDGVIKGLPLHGLDPDYLASLGFKRVLSGHYHNHKQMHPGFNAEAEEGGGDFYGEVYSIGALAHHTWSDIGTKAGFLIVHPDRVEWRKSHLPEFIDLSQLVDLDPADIPFLVDQNYVRVKVEASKTRDVEQARQELLDMGAKAVIVQAQPKPPVREGTERATVASGASLEVSVTDFIKAMPGVAVEEVTKAALAVLGSVDSTKE